MEINLNQVQQSTSQATNTGLTGAAAPQTEAQRADVSATRVVSPKESAVLEDKASGADEARFSAIKSRAAKFVGGENPFLSDIKFTIYGQNASNSGIGEYVIRFTDLSTGRVEVKTDFQLFEGTGGGDLVSGQV
jgi:hypothetical protein